MSSFLAPTLGALAAWNHHPRASLVQLAPQLTCPTEHATWQGFATPASAFHAPPWCQRSTRNGPLNGHPDTRGAWPDHQHPTASSWSVLLRTHSPRAVILQIANKRAHPDLNQGPADLQSAALITELCTQLSANPLGIHEEFSHSGR